MNERLPEVINQDTDMEPIHAAQFDMPVLPAQQATSNEVIVQEAEQEEAVKLEEIQILEDMAAKKAVVVSGLEAEGKLGGPDDASTIDLALGANEDYCRVREKLTQKYERRVKAITRHIYKGPQCGFTLDELMDVGYIGLIIAANRFDLSRSSEFGAYASTLIGGTIRRYLRDHSRVPSSTYRKMPMIHAATMILKAEGIDDPSPEQIARASAGLRDGDEVNEALNIFRDVMTTQSLDALTAGDGSSVEAPTLLSYKLRGGEFEERSDSFMDLHNALKGLDPREKKILTMYFYQDATQTQIGKEIGFSQMHASRLIAQALSKLRDKLDVVD